MKKLLALLLAFTFVFGAFAQNKSFSSVSPKDAKSMGMGGAFVAMSEGYQSLYGNPADFASKKGSLNLFSGNPWIYVKPTTENLETFQTILDSEDSTDAIISAAEPLIIDNGFGAGASLGLGWVGRGLGLGVYGVADAAIGGTALLGAEADVTAQVCAVAGLGIPLQLGPFRLQVGADLRPFVVATGTTSAIQLLGMLSGDSGFDIMQLNVDAGYGFAVDLGASFSVGKFISVGLAIRDVSAGLTLNNTTLENFVSNIVSFNFTGTEASYTMLPNIVVGASLKPFSGALAKLVDLTVTAEIQDPIAVAVENADFWNLLHVGTEAKFLSGLVSARAGLNKGWLCFGAGINLFLVEANVAVFTEELGLRPGADGRTGVAADVTIHF